MSYQDDKDQDDKDQDQGTPQGLSELEDYALYESGLTAHGCMDNMDAYAMDSIKRYGRILFKAAYHDATAFKAYKEYTGLMPDSKRLTNKLTEIKERCEKLKKAMKYSPSCESLLSKFIQATQDIQEAREEIRLLKAIMDGMKDKANE